MNKLTKPRYEADKTQCQKKRLAYLTSEYPALSHTFILREIEALEERGHTVYPISVGKPRYADQFGPKEHKEAKRTPVIKDKFLAATFFGLLFILFNNPLDLFRMAGRTTQAWKANPLKPLHAWAYFLQACCIIRWMRKDQLSHIHNHFGNAAGTVAWIAGAAKGISYSLSIHGPDIFLNVDSELLQRKINNARWVRSISHFCKSQLCLITDPSQWDKIEIVRCGVNIEDYEPAQATSNSTPVVLCVGRLVPAKAQQNLVEASIQLWRQGFQHELRLVGNGPDRARLEARVRQAGASEWITFTGGMSQSQVRQEMQAADLFVLPSFAEGIPVVLMEAMALKRPVITTPIAGIPELVTHNENGFLVPPASVSDLVAAIKEVIRDTEHAQAMGRAARFTVESQYNLSSNGKAMAIAFELYL